MMKSPLILKESMPEIGYLCRNIRSGPEKNLVEEFVEIVSADRKMNSKYSSAIFFEPRLDIGFPDVVIVKYSESSMADWTSSRVDLDMPALKILAHFYYVAPLTIEDICAQLGFEYNFVHSKLSLLADNKLLYKRNNYYYPYQLKKKFALREVIAIEAKMSNWDKVITQASNNKWFTTTSYVLTPVVNPMDKIKAKCNNAGIGVFGLRSGSLREVVPARSHDLPMSYVILLLNEWVARYSYKYGGVS